jgi:hypothetical protein
MAAVVVALVAVPGPSPAAMRTIGHVAAAGVNDRRTDVAVAAPGVMPKICESSDVRDAIVCDIAQRYQAGPGHPRVEVLRACDAASEACSHSDHRVVVVNY